MAPDIRALIPHVVLLFAFYYGYFIIYLFIYIFMTTECSGERKKSFPNSTKVFTHNYHFLLFIIGLKNLNEHFSIFLNIYCNLLTVYIFSL